MPSAQMNFIQIPGRNGSLDLSESFGSVRYSDRAFAITLYAIAPYEESVSAFVNDVHGERMDIVFDRDLEFQYAGRVSVGGLEKHDGYCTITVNITAEPYKLKRSVTKVSITGNGNAILSNLSMPVVPTVTASADATITYKSGGASVTVTLSAGVHTIPSLMLLRGTNIVNVVTTGTVTFSYQEGAL